MDASPQETSRFVPSGLAYFALNSSKPPQDFYFLLLPRTTMLAFSAAIEPLRIANQLTGKCLYRWHIVSETGEPVECSNGILINTDGPLQKIQPNATLLVCSGLKGHSAASAKTLDALRRHKRLGGTVGGICTGSYSLALAGLLTGRGFTLHWENQGAFSEKFPDLVSSDQLFMIDQKVITCGGGVAAVDLMLTLIESDFGSGLAQKIGDMCVLGAHRKESMQQRKSRSLALNSRNPRLICAVETMSENIEEPLCLNAVAAQAGASVRQIERLFKRYLGMTPSKFYRDMRLDLGRGLIQETDMPIIEIALACGYSSASHFSKNYRCRFGISPFNQRTKAC